MSYIGVDNCHTAKERVRVVNFLDNFNAIKCDVYGAIKKMKGKTYG